MPKPRADKHGRCKDALAVALAVLWLRERRAEKPPYG